MFNQERTYYYVTAWVEGRKVVLGPFSTEDDANQEGYLKVDGDYEVTPLPTRDLGRAVRMLRMQNGEDINQSFQRTRHVI